MENSIVSLQEAFKDINYIDSNHTYVHTPTNTKLISVTQLLGKTKKEFNKQFWLSKKASELQITEDELNHRWWILNQIGTTRGSLIHKYMEDKLARKVYQKNYGNLSSVLNTLEYIEYIQSIDKLILMVESFVKDNPNLIPIMSEVVVGNIEIGIAGMFDQLFFDKNLNGYVIYDWKTDKEFKTSNRYQKFLKPLDHLDDCQFNKYSLQLSLYKYIIEKYTEIKILDLKVVWFFHKSDTYQVIDIPYRKTDIETLIKYYNDNK
jgi:ATP-dependent exoDNAse (exonuclease V) beta subunit